MFGCKAESLQEKFEEHCSKESKPSEACLEAISRPPRGSLKLCDSPLILPPFHPSHTHLLARNSTPLSPSTIHLFTLHPSSTSPHHFTLHHPGSPTVPTLQLSPPPQLSTVHLPPLCPPPRSCLQVSVIISRPNLDDHIVSADFG